MISTETISDKIQMLPPNSQKELLEFIDDLLEKSARSNQKEKDSAWEDWAKGYSENAVIVDDRRDSIYEDEYNVEDIQADTNILLRSAEPAHPTHNQAVNAVKTLPAN